jgi:hypothetical protein
VRELKGGNKGLFFYTPDNPSEFSKRLDFCCNKTHCVFRETFGVLLICSHQKKHTLIVDARECSPVLSNALLVLAGARWQKI